MQIFNWKEQIQPFDERRDIVIPGDTQETVLFCTRQFLQIGNEAIKQRGKFIVALSGGQTPHAIFKELSQSHYSQALDWSKVLCFWSDERSVPTDHAENNYSTAMKAGLANLPINPENIFRMPAENNIEEQATAYETLIRQKLPSLHFDLLMLGMGDDGHTASLFPRTHGLHTTDHLVIANYVPQKNTWRMSFTYECINMARVICLYIMGANKSSMVVQALTGPYTPDDLPVQRVGTPSHKALWILDKAASEKLMETMQQ